MKIFIACDSYKGCMSSKKVKAQIESGIHQFDPNIETVSYAIGDGGEGTVEAFHDVCGGHLHTAMTTNAYGKKIECSYVILEDQTTAVIEVANIIGLQMTPREKRMPFLGSSFGVGTVILDAINQGCKRIIVGLGGSATNDGGMGILQCLGARFYDEHHKYLSPQAMNLEKIRYIDFNRLNKLEEIELIAACDVSNHLLGKEGATYVFGKQKGLYPNQIQKLDRAMQHYQNQIMRYTKVDLNTFDGGGAAGGIGAVLIGLLGAKMQPGVELLMEYSDMETQIQSCDLVITGEGQSDRQTLYGKVPMGILKLATKYQKPTLCISGALGIGYQELYQEGFIGIFSIADRAMTFEQALKDAPQKLEAMTFSLMKTIGYFNK